MKRINSVPGIKNAICLSFLLLAGCQSIESPEYNPAAYISNPPSATPQPQRPKIAEATPKPQEKDHLTTTDKTQEKPDETETVSTETEVIKTNVVWKVFNPVIKGKKYTYIYTIKEGTREIQTETLWEILEVAEKSYKLRQTILTSGKDTQLRATESISPINSDGSPSIIPVISVGGEAVKTNTEIEINETPEKITVPAGEIEAVKVTAKTGSYTTTNWYGKNTGLVKAIQTAGDATYTLELKKYE